MVQRNEIRSADKHYPLALTWRLTGDQLVRVSVMDITTRNVQSEFSLPFTQGDFDQLHALGQNSVCARNMMEQSNFAASFRVLAGLVVSHPPARQMVADLHTNVLAMHGHLILKS